MQRSCICQDEHGEGEIISREAGLAMYIPNLPYHIVQRN